MDRRSAKSPMPRTPLARSPMQTSPMLYETYKSRCAYGLLDFFHIRRGHSKKLIGNGCGSNGNAECEPDMENTLLNVDAKCQCTDNEGDKGQAMIDSCKAKVMKTVVENTSFREQTKEEVISSKLKNRKASSESLSSNCRKGTASRRPHCFLKYGCYDVATVDHREASHKDLVEGTSSKLTFAATAEALSNQAPPQNKEHVVHECISCAKHDPTNGINVQLQMNGATEAFINQKLIDGKRLTEDKAAHKSKHFVDALKILNSNKDLFMKLLQDPNSVLVKHIEDLRDSRVKRQQATSIEANQQENPATEAKEYHKSSFGVRKLRSRAKLFSKGDSQSFEQIVVLKPGSRSLQNCEDDLSRESRQFVHSLKNVQHSVSPLDKIKRKLSHAVRLSLKEEQSKLPDHTGSNCICNSWDSEKCGIVTDMKIVRRTTECKNPFDIGGITNYKLKIFESDGGKEGASASGSKLDNLKFSNLRFPSQNKDELSVEDRMHLCKPLNTGKANFSVQQKAITWDGMIDMPDYDLLPVISPRKKWEYGSINPQMRFSLCADLDTGKGKMLRNHGESSDSCSSPERPSVEFPEQANYEEQCQELQTLEKIPNTSYKVLRDVELLKSFSCLENDPCLRGSTRRIESSDCVCLKANKPSKRSCEQERPHYICSSQSTDTDDSFLEVESSELSRLDLHKDNPVLLSPTDECLSSPASVRKGADSVSNKDTAEHSSPVSVLERFFMDDVTSPSGTESEPEPSQQSGTAEDHMAKVFQSSLHWRMKSSALSEEHEFVIKYICEVLQASDIDWDDKSSNYHEKDQFFDRIVWDKVHVWPSQFGSNPTLLIDFVVEVLEYVYQHHLRCSPWVLFILPKVCPLELESIALEVMNYIVQDLNLCPSSRTLQQLVEKDLAKSGMWFNIKVDSEEIVAETVESILNKLMVEATIE